MAGPDCTIHVSDLPISSARRVSHIRVCTALVRMSMPPVALVLGLIPALAAAAPGEAHRLGGVDAQGVTARSVTAIHHNPAMLGSLVGAQFHTSVRSGLDQRWVRRTGLDASGFPTEDSGDRVSLLNPMFDYFAGATVYLEPFALGAAVYTLNNSLQLTSSDGLRYHLAPGIENLPGQCVGRSERACALGGAATYRTDFSLAFAWSVLSNLNIGLGVHFPRLRSRFSFDNSSVLSDSERKGDCTNLEDPACSERIAFSGVNRWLPASGTRLAGFDLALTLGLAYEITSRVTFGVRYRTRPLLRGGNMQLSGQVVICRPSDTEPQPGDAPSCSVAQPLDATLRERIPQELALGFGVVLGRGKQWRIDSTLLWVDNCHDVNGDPGIANCGDPGGQQLNLVGLEQSRVLLSDSVRYRGLQDMFGLDVYTTYQVASNLSISFAGHAASPSVQRAAMSASHADGWRTGLSLGTAWRVRQSNFLLVPGYGADFYFPTSVSATQAAFDPGAAERFAAAHSDINSADAQAILEGRGRPTNAGRYTGLVHSVSLALRWQPRSLGLN